MSKKLSEFILCIQKGISNSNYPEDRALAAKYLAQLAPILAKVELGVCHSDDIEGFERFLGNSWLKDLEPFGEFYTHWKNFRREFESH